MATPRDTAGSARLPKRKEPRHPWAGRGGRGHFQDLRVSIGNSNPSHGARVAAQEEEGDVASCGHQVDEHGHPNGPEGRKTELLYQETTQEDPQAGTGDRSHPWERNRGAGTVSRGRRARPHRPLDARCGAGWGGLSPAQAKFPVTPTAVLPPLGCL